jgi:quercetin dioxygenase-like cupin family protein
MTVSTDLKVVDNVFVKMMHLYWVGDKVVGHAHTFDHITLLAKGTVLMKANGEVREHAAPKLIVTPKGVVHEFEAVTPDCLLCCVHAIRDGDTAEDIAPPDMTEEQAQEFLRQFPLTQKE